MPARMLGITDAEAAKLATFLIETGKGANGAPDAASKAIYMSKGCIGCHGPTLAGNQMLGAANLSDGIYRFKADNQHASVVRTILHGVNQHHDSETQNAEMPAFGNSKVIDAVQIKKLAVYVHQLGGGVPVKAAPKQASVSSDPKYTPVVAKSDSLVDVLAAAQANYDKNFSQNAAWRDTQKMIKDAKKNNDVVLAKKANTQAVNALRQASMAESAGPTF